jgi:hypothetical protein
MNHRPTDATNLRLVPSEDPQSDGPRERAAESALALESRLSAIVPSWLLSLVLHAGLFALLAVSLPGLRGGIVGDPDGDLRSVGIWVGHSGDGSDGDGSGTGSAKAAAGETKLVPSVKNDPQTNQVASTAPTPTTIPDVFGSSVRREISPPAVLDPVAPNPVAARLVAVSPVLGPGPGPERRGLYQPNVQPGAASRKSVGPDSGSGGRRGSQGSTPFFGIVDVGSRFVYLID